MFGCGRRRYGNDDGRAGGHMVDGGDGDFRLGVERDGDGRVAAK